MISWLKRAASLLIQGIAIVEGFGPLAQMARPGATGVIATVMSDLEQVKAIILKAEVMGQSLGLPGDQKLRAAAPLVAQIIKQSSALAGHNIADHPKFYAACTSFASAFADVLNTLEADDAKAA